MVFQQTASMKPHFGIGLRLRAWWEGVDPADLLDVQPQPKSRAVQKETSLVAPLEDWENARIRIMQMIWGAGWNMPGGTVHLSTLAKPAGLDPSKSVMVFGAGLGGAVRAIATEYGVWTTGYEAENDLAHAGKHLSFVAGLDRKAEMQIYVPDDFEPSPNSFDCILSAEALHRYMNKHELLGKFQRCLRPKGQLSMTDFVLAPGVKPNDPRLKPFGKQQLEFWHTGQYEQRFRELSLDLRVTEDIGEKYRQMILRSWAELARGDPVKLATTRMFLREFEAELACWANRLKALESGVLQLQRFYIIKKSETRLMSDW